MTRIYELLEAAVEHDLDVTLLSQDEIQKISRLTLRKLPMNRKKISGKRIFLIAAAICLLGSLGVYVFARTRTAADVFLPVSVFEEPNEVGEVVPISADSEKVQLIEKAGAVIDQTIEQDNLLITLRGVVGDNESINLLIEIADKNGDPITSDNSTHPQQFRFNHAFIRIDTILDNGTEDVGHYVAPRRIDDGTDPAKMTFLIQEYTYLSDIVGKKATLELQGLGKMITTNATPIAFEYADMQEISELFPSPEAEEFYYDLIPEQVLNSLRENGGGLIPKHLHRDREGNYISNPYLPDSGISLPFSSDYPNTSVVAMGFFMDEFHMALVCEDEREWKTLSDRGLSLINKETGESFDSSSSYEFSDTRTPYGKHYFNPVEYFPAYQQHKLNTGYVYFRFRTGSVSDLTNLILTTSSGPYFEPIVFEDTWSFEFSLDYENTSLVYEPAKTVSWKGNTFVVERVSVSPFSLKISCSGWIRDDSTKRRDPDLPISLQMLDGSKLELNNMLSCITTGSDSEGFTSSTLLPVVIDAEQVAGIWIGDAEIVF